MGYRNSRGLTLIELVVTLAVLSILLALAGPAFQDLVARNQVSAATNRFIASLHLARSEAVRTGSHVSLCPGSADACGGRDYAGGWTLFVDRNHDGRRQANEGVIRVFDAAGPGLSISGNSTVEAHISYAPIGFTELPGGAFQAGTITVCRPPYARRVVISRTGRPRVEAARC